MAFLSQPDEVDTTPLILKAWQDGKRVLAPRVDWEQRRLIPTELRSLTERIEHTQWGLRQPAQGESVSLQMIDLILVPGLSFDPAGNRLGRGRGFYDAFLAQIGLRARTCGLCMEEQIVGQVPSEPHDMRVKLLVTDREVRRFV